jgi:DNA-binding beta-propeller fold protein YncE
MNGARRRRSVRTTGLLIVAACLISSAGCAGSSSRVSNPVERLSLDLDIALPGTTSRFDYQSLDPTSHTLWIAHLGDSTVISINLKTLEVAAPVTGITGVHGVLAVPGRNVVYATATGTNEIVAIDATTHQITARAATGTFPDGLAFDPDHNLLLVSSKTDGTISVHDPGTLPLIRTIKLGGETGNVTYDPITRHGYAATLPPDALIEFDPVTGTIINTIKLPGCDGAHGMMINPSERCAYVACENNARLAVIDLTTTTQTATMFVGAGPDVLAIDPTTHRLYIAAESGDVTLFDIATGPAINVGTQHVNDDAHTIAVDPDTHLVYLPLANVNGHPVLRMMRHAV